MDENSEFIATGRQFLTELAQAAEKLKIWQDAFTQRGGTDTFGNDATLIAYNSADLQTWLTDSRRQLIARLRTDV